MVTIEPVASRDHLFISYRYDDARGASGRLYDWLRIGFGRERVFRDVHSIGIGKWREKIDAALVRSSACIAVIGPRWASADNLRRLHDENDMVRHELVRALTDDAVILVPTLVEGAAIPSVDALPPIVRQLFDAWNARRVTEDGWEDDIRRLISELAEETGLPVGPDLDIVLRNAGAAQQRVTELEQERDFHTDQIRALRRSLDDLATKLAEALPKERPHIGAAFSALAEGNTLAAEDSFEREFEARRQAREEESGAMAEAARNVANLALVRDVQKAASFYRKALAVAPQDDESWRLLGRALILLGDLKGAVDAMNDSLSAAVTHADKWGEMAAHVGIGDVARLRGNLQPALDAFTEAQRLTEAMLEIDPANTEWQRDLSVSHTKIGDVLVARGDGAAALAAYRQGLAICEALSARDPANTEWQRDLSVSHERIGDVLVAQGDGPTALAAYRQGLAICEALAARDPANTEWQRDLSVSHDRNGDMLVAQGDGPAALAAYRQGLTVCEALAVRDPANTEWQRDLSVSHNKIGDVLVAQGDGPAALAAYRQGLTVREALAVRDPANTEWQRDLSVSHNKIGDVLVAQGDGPEALAAYRQGLAIREALAARDPANTEWQRDLSVGHERIGDVLVAQGDGPTALAAYRQGLAIREALAARDPANTDGQRDLSVSHDRIGNVLVAQGDGPAALAAYRQGLAIREALAARDSANTQWQRDLSVSHDKIGNVLVVQGDGPAALAAYRQGLAIREALAARDPANTEWRTDVAVSCAKLGALEAVVSLEMRRSYLQRGVEILLELKSQGRLMPNKDWIRWFEEQLAGLTEPQ